MAENPRPEADAAREIETSRADREWVTPQVSKLDLETAQQTGIPGG
ncbi:hypothetical protein [Sphingomonas sp.]|nr:hypothetical protein [Sphingomonas sp.]MBO9714780.1 hypothetical protein [Sphingomonas sp.]